MNQKQINLLLARKLELQGELLINGIFGAILVVILLFTFYLIIPLIILIPILAIIGFGANSRRRELNEIKFKLARVPESKQNKLKIVSRFGSQKKGLYLAGFILLGFLSIFIINLPITIPLLIFLSKKYKEDKKHFKENESKRK